MYAGNHSLHKVATATKMVRSRLSASVESPKVDVIVDCGHPLLNVSVDGFLKVGGVRMRPAP